MKRQGKRTDLTSNQFGWKLNHANETDPNSNETGQNPTSNQFGWKLASADSLAKQANTSATQVRRFIRLTHLSYSLLDKVDIGELPIVASVELSYLDRNPPMNNVAMLYESPLK